MACPMQCLFCEMFEDPEEQSGIRLPTRRVERRSGQRVALDVPVLVDSLSRWDTCQCQDVSIGGFSMRSDSEWLNGAVVDIYFELPNGRAVETQARVVARSPGRTHLSFLSLGPVLRAAVASYVKSRSTPVIRNAGPDRQVRRVLPQRS